LKIAFKWDLVLKIAVAMQLVLAINFAGAVAMCLASTEQTSPDVHQLSANRYAELDSLTADVLKKELEIERLSLRFFLEATPANRWKAWRYFLFQESNAAGIEAGLQVGIVERARQLAHQKVGRRDLEDSLIPQMVGQFVGAAGDGVELTLNAIRAFETRRKKLDEKNVRREVSKLQAEIEKELNERTEILSRSTSLSQAELGIFSAEQKVLVDLQRLAQLQFNDYRNTVRRQEVSQNVFYVLDAAKNLTGAAGNLVGIDQQFDQRPALGVPSNVLTTISGALIAANPLLSRLAGVASEHHQYSRKAHDPIRQSAIDALNKDLIELKNLCQLHERDVLQIAMINRLAIYDNHNEKDSDYVKQLKRERQKAYGAALNRVFVGGFVGSAKMSLGITGIIASDRFPKSPVGGAPMLLGGTTAYASATLVTLGDNLTIEVQRELQYQHNKKLHRLPREVLEEQISRLVQLETPLNK
jgi:hypothetical protein